MGVSLGMFSLFHLFFFFFCCIDFLGYIFFLKVGIDLFYQSIICIPTKNFKSAPIDLDMLWVLDQINTNLIIFDIGLIISYTFSGCVYVRHIHMVPYES